MPTLENLFSPTLHDRLRLRSGGDVDRGYDIIVDSIQSTLNIVIELEVLGFSDLPMEPGEDREAAIAGQRSIWERKTNRYMAMVRELTVTDYEQGFLAQLAVTPVEAVDMQVPQGGSGSAISSMVSSALGLDSALVAFVNAHSSLLKKEDASAFWSVLVSKGLRTLTDVQGAFKRIRKHLKPLKGKRFKRALADRIGPLDVGASGVSSEVADVVAGGAST
jgi:hypothetical protein